MYGYKSKQKFSKEQLIFVVQSILVGMADSLEPQFPYNTYAYHYKFQDNDDFLSVCDYVMDTASCQVSCFAAQILNDGVESTILYNLPINYNNFVRNWINKGIKRTKCPENNSCLDFSEMSKKIVELLFKDYLK